MKSDGLLIEITKDRRIDGWIDGVSLTYYSNLVPSLFSVSLAFTTRTQQARIAADLIELRNKSVFAFLMFNALFVLIVFLLQLNKDQLHVIWPLGVKTNITYVEETSEVSDDQASGETEVGAMVVSCTHDVPLKSPSMRPDGHF